MATFPQAGVTAAVSGDIYAGERPVVGAFGSFARSMEALGGTLDGMANRAAQANAERTAAQDVAAGKSTLQPDTTVYGAAYNQVRRRELGVRMEASVAEQMGTVFADHGDDPAGLAKALDAIRAGTPSTNDPQLDASLHGQFLLRRADMLSRAAAGLHQRTVEAGQANFLQTLKSRGELLDQVAAGATFDDAGGTRVAGALGELVKGLAQYGPKIAFSAGGIDFPADDTRAGALGADDVAKAAIAAQAEAKTTWIVNTAQRLPDAAAKHAFVADLRKRYAAGDPALSGLDGAHADALLQHLDAQADKADVDQRQDQHLHAENARNAIEALQWGGDVDPVQMLAEAHASGDPGLVAQAQFFAEVPKALRGVLKTVVARQLGLLPSGDPGLQWLDPSGAPIAAGEPGAGGVSWANPGATLGGLLGGPVQVTSTFRTPAHNAEVHGVPNSYHLSGQAADFKPPAGMTTAAAAAKLKASGVPLAEVIDERTHVHVAWGSPWQTPRDAAPGTPVFAAWASAREGFASDPINFARKQQLTTVAPLNPDAFADPAGQAAWGAAMRQRQAAGVTLARTYGVPSRMLTDGEVSAYKAKLTADPASAVALAGAASAALGPSGAQAFLREIGANGQEGTAPASVPLHIAQLKAWGMHTIADAAALGLQLKAQGAKAPSYSKADDEANWMATQTELAPALRYVPQVMAAAVQTAELARLADANRGIDQPAGYYLQSAVGGRTQGGRNYGGIRPVNGADTVLPHWLAADAAGDALHALGDSWTVHGNGPRYGNGQAARAADLARAQLVLRPNGHYWLVQPATRQPFGGAAGKPFELDLDANRDFLAHHVPGAVLRGP